MSKISDRAKARRTALREELRIRYPNLFPKPRPALPTPVDRSAIVLGRNQGGAPVFLPEQLRLQHAHVIGTTGAGKTKFLEHCIRQDVASGRGVCVVDPHGNHPDSLYRSLLGWLDERGYTDKNTNKSRQIHLIDPNASTHITGFDPLALPSSDYDPSVIADAALEALERVWGEEDTDTKPTLQRVLTATLTALCELKLTLAEARLLFDPDDRAGIRRWAIQNLTDDEAREEFQWLHEIAAEPRFFLPVRVLSKLFRRLMLEKLAAADAAGQLQFFGVHAHLAGAEAFAAFLAPLRKTRWFVYAKRPFAGPKAVLAYLSRYTHRVAISNSR